MEPEAKYTLVGTAVLVLVALIVVAAVWLRTTGATRQRTVQIYFARQSLEGLQIRSDVKMQGIKVGSVTGFRISAGRPGTVEVVIRVVGTTPIRQSTRANVERQLLTGIANIRLVNINETSPLLTEAPSDEPYPLIAEGESEYKFSESVAQIAQRADETMQRINLALSDENQVALSEILVNLRRISANADRNMASLDRTLVPRPVRMRCDDEPESPAKLANSGALRHVGRIHPAVKVPPRSKHDRRCARLATRMMAGRGRQPGAAGTAQELRATPFTGAAARRSRSGQNPVRTVKGAWSRGGPGENIMRIVYGCGRRACPCNPRSTTATLLRPRRRARKQGPKPPASCCAVAAHHGSPVSTKRRKSCSAARWGRGATINSTAGRNVRAGG